MADRESLVINAKLAEQAERYDGKLKSTLEENKVFLFISFRYGISNEVCGRSR